MKGRLGVMMLVLTACGGGSGGYAYRYARVTGPDGTRNWYALECDETFDCYRAAGKLCKFGYNVADGNATESTESTGSATRIGNTTVARSSSRGKRGAAMLVHCTERPNDAEIKP